MSLDIGFSRINVLRTILIWRSAEIRSPGRFVVGKFHISGIVISDVLIAIALSSHLLKASVLVQGAIILPIDGFMIFVRDCVCGIGTGRVFIFGNRGDMHSSLPLVFKRRRRSILWLLDWDLGSHGHKVQTLNSRSCLSQEY